MTSTLHASPRWLRNFYFWSGIVATFAYRIIVILNNYSKPLAQAAWYVGTIGFVIYFLHRYQISERRANLIREHDLITKTKNDPALQYILKTLLSTKEKYNYIFIFVMSVVAFVIGIYLDFF